MREVIERRLNSLFVIPADEYPASEALVYNNEVYEKVRNDMINLGYAPVPRNRLEWLVYDICHGLIMRYPLWRVLGWSFCQIITAGDRGWYWRDGASKQ